MIDVGQRVRDYQIVAHLKPGGMATLFLARRIGPQGFARPVAIKVVHPHLAHDPDLIRMFLDEARLSACIQHPHVVHVEELGEFAGTYFLAMEYLHGDSLASLLSALARLELALPIETAVWIASACAAGLHAAHEARGDDGVPLRLVHRDVSPQNVLVSIDGHVLLIDFGIVHVRDGSGTEAGALKGKLAYMSPEQANGGVIDRRTDVYALGIVLWEMLAMKRLFGGQGDIEVLDAVRNPVVVPPSTFAPGVTPALDAVVLRALAREPDARFATAEEMQQALLAAIPAGSGAAPQLAREVSRHLGERIEARRREIVAGATMEPRTAASAEEPTAAAPGRSVATQRSAVLADAHAIAVMPFRVTGAEASVGEGLADELRDVLSRVRGLRVKSRAAMREAEDASVYGERLGVGFVITGRVSGDPMRLRLALALTKVEDGFQVWSQKIERPLEGLWAALDDVARAIAGELGDASLRGTRAPADSATIELSLALRRVAAQAVLADPRETLALIARADVVAPRDPVILASGATALARTTYWPSPPPHALDEARARSERAVDLAPELPEPWIAAAQVRLASGDSPGAVRALRRAVATGPSLAEPYDLLSRILSDADRLDEALRLSEQAIWLDPASAFARRERVRIFGLREDWSACERELERLRGENLEQYAAVAVRVSLWAGRDLGERLEVDTTPAVLEITRAAWRLLDTRTLLPEDDARFVRVIATLAQTRALRFYHQLRAEMCAFAGEHDRAIAALTGATDNGLEDVAWLDRCSLLRPFRADPRLAEPSLKIRARAAAVQRAWDDW